MAADDAASPAAEAADTLAEADISAAEAAVSDDVVVEAGVPVSAAGVVFSACLLQAARATAATKEANRSDFFMNFLEEIWFDHYR